MSVLYEKDVFEVPFRVHMSLDRNLIFIDIIDLPDYNTKSLVSITEANQKFSKVARLIDENGSAVILKNNVPRYLIIEFSQAENEQLANNEDVMAVSKRLIAKNKEAYEVLAK